MKILFFVHEERSFTEKDFNILKSNYVVTKTNSNENIFEMIRLIKENDLIYLWFASIRFFIPVLIGKVMGKKIVIVAGGYDVAKVKKVECSSMCSLWKSKLVKIMLKLSDKVIAVSKSNEKEIIKNCKINEAKIEMVYHGFEEIENNSQIMKSNIIVTIGFINHRSFFRKGIDRFLCLARELSEFDFFIIGENEYKLDKLAVPPNVHITGYLERNKFNLLLQKAKIYIQFSRHEAFGCSVAEAMQFGCIPVVSNSYSLPEVVGDCGIKVNEFKDYHQIAIQIKDLVINFDSNLSMKCKERVRNKFNYEQRKESILNIINLTLTTNKAE